MFLIIIMVEEKAFIIVMWLSQKQLAVVFGKSVKTINEHIQNILKKKS